jgi:hypothetical protein
MSDSTLPQYYETNVLTPPPNYLSTSNVLPAIPIVVPMTDTEKREFDKKERERAAKCWETFLTVIWILLLAALPIICGIVEFIYVGLNDISKSCNVDVNRCIIACATFHLVIGLFITVSTLIDKLLGNNWSVVTYNINSFIILPLLIAALGLSIWALKIYYSTSSECIDVFTSQAASLWSMIAMNMVFCYIILCSVGLWVLAYFIIFIVSFIDDNSNCCQNCCC